MWSPPTSSWWRRRAAELLALAKEKGVNYLFEASVGGGIPVLHPLTQCMAANRIDEVYGILNGTTNYILTRMVRAGAIFADALREAQAKGYAEADPTADVEGIDAGRKICILADLAFGRQVDSGGCAHGGDQPAVSPGREDRPAGGLPRSSCWAGRCACPAGRTAYVAPHLIPEEQPLASVEDVFNAVVVKGNATGEVMFYGQGRRGAAHGLRLRGGRDGGASVQPPPGGDRLGGGPGGL